MFYIFVKKVIYNTNMADIFPPRADHFTQWYSHFANNVAQFQVILPTILTNVVLDQVNVNNEAIRAAHFYTTGLNYHNKGLAEFKKSLLDGNFRHPLGPVSAPPDPLVMPAGVIAGIKPWTRRLIRQIKSHPDFQSSMGVALRIVTAPIEREDPSIVVRSVRESSVTLRIRRGGYSAVAIEGKRGGGDWEAVGFAMISKFEDARPPLEEGRAEWREYRAQGIHRNERTGGMSPIVGTWTAPSG